jgi:hypothetical protein
MIVQETEKGQFRVWNPTMPVTVDATEETVTLSSVAGWTATELAAVGLYNAVPFTPPEGKQITGNQRFERIKGTVSEVYDVEDIPPPPPEPTKAERLEQMLADYGLTKADLVEVINEG